MSIATLILALVYLFGTAAYAAWRLLRTVVLAGNIPLVPSAVATVERLLALPAVWWPAWILSSVLLLDALSRAPELLRQTLAGSLLIVAVPCAYGALCASARRWRAFDHERRVFLVAVLGSLALFSPPIVILAVGVVVGRRLYALARQPGVMTAELLIGQLVIDLERLLAPLFSALAFLAGALRTYLLWLTLLVRGPRSTSLRPQQRAMPSIALLLFGPSLAPRAPPAAA